MSVDFSIFQSAFPYRGFTAEDWDILSRMVQEVKIPANTTIFRENDKGDGFYWVRSGKVRISRQVVSEGKPGTQEQLLTLLTAGQLFGEMALADQAPRSADAIAEGDTVLYYVSQADYEKIKNENPTTALQIQDVIARILCARMREANRSFEVIYFLFS